MLKINDFCQRIVKIFMDYIAYRKQLKLVKTLKKDDPFIYK